MKFIVKEIALPVTGFTLFLLPRQSRLGEGKNKMMVRSLILAIIPYIYRSNSSQACPSCSHKIKKGSNKIPYY